LNSDNSLLSPPCHSISLAAPFWTLGCNIQELEHWVRMKAGENTRHVVLLPTTEQDAALEELGHWDLVEEKQAEVGGCEELEHWDLVEEKQELEHWYLVEEKQAQVGGCEELEHWDLVEEKQELEHWYLIEEKQAQVGWDLVEEKQELEHWYLIEEKQAQVGGCEELEHWDLVEEKQAQVGGCDEVQKDHHLDVIAVLLLQRLQRKNEHYCFYAMLAELEHFCHVEDPEKQQPQVRGLP
jgi:hypothetical protein